jgi:FKBP-type peptidyl-prolyl cis-trans isomerase
LGQGQLIAGLEEGLVGMREGGSRRILIPSVLGYTDRYQAKTTQNPRISREEFFEGVVSLGFMDE